MIKFKNIILENDITGGIYNFSPDSKRYINSLIIEQNQYMVSKRNIIPISDKLAYNQGETIIFKWLELLSIEPRKSKMGWCEIGIEKSIAEGPWVMSRTDLNMSSGKKNKLKGAAAIIQVWYKKDKKVYFKYTNPLIIPIQNNNVWEELKAIKTLLKILEQKLNMKLFEKI